MREQDVGAVRELMIAGFDDLARRMNEPPHAPGDPARAYVRLRRVLTSDPGGSWVTRDGESELTGAALAIMRDGVWGLSLLVVRPDRQSTGVGTALLRRTLEYGAGARGGIILASADPRALRAYFRAGFALHPAMAASGRPRDLEPDPAVRRFLPDDHALAAAVDRAVRGAAHGADLDALAAGGCELFTYPERGYAVLRGAEVISIAAFDDDAAAALLLTVLAHAPADDGVEVAWLTGAQQWAIDVVVAAGLELRAGGAVFLRGDVGPFHPYLPGGAYL
jgi:GNAT superfamily N-acetyltransferase